MITQIKLKMITPMPMSQKTSAAGDRIRCERKELNDLMKGYKEWALAEGHAVVCRGEQDSIGGFGVQIHDESCCSYFLKYSPDEDAVVRLWLTTRATEEEYDLVKRWWTCVMLDQLNMASAATDHAYKTMRQEKALEIVDMISMITALDPFAKLLCSENG